tara:strand:+ start:5149 stop:5418 length:270 start_codon:yes stop_codon:yes gene_type:complete
MWAEEFCMEMSIETARETKDAATLAVRELEDAKQFPPPDLKTAQRRARVVRIDQIIERLDQLEDLMGEILEEAEPETASQRANRWPSVI